MRAAAACAAPAAHLLAAGNGPDTLAALKVGQCRLTPSTNIESAWNYSLETGTSCTAFKFCFLTQLAPLQQGADGADGA
jgi:hypothetical protein